MANKTEDNAQMLLYYLMIEHLQVAGRQLNIYSPANMKICYWLQFKQFRLT